MVNPDWFKRKSPDFEIRPVESVEVGQSRLVAADCLRECLFV
jgi:hypothetical protein